MGAQIVGAREGERKGAKNTSELWRESTQTEEWEGETTFCFPDIIESNSKCSPPSTTSALQNTYMLIYTIANNAATFFHVKRETTFFSRCVFRGQELESAVVGEARSSEERERGRTLDIYVGWDWCRQAGALA